MVPLGTVGAGGLKKAFDEVAAGNREIVATIVRDGIPLPTRTQVLKRYKEKLSGAARKVERERDGSRLTLKAIARKDREPPDAWEYVLSSKAGTFAVGRGKNGESVTVKLPNFQKKVRVTVRPVFHERVLSGGATSVPIS